MGQSALSVDFIWLRSIVRWLCLDVVACASRWVVAAHCYGRSAGSIDFFAMVSQPLLSLGRTNPVLLDGRLDRAGQLRYYRRGMALGSPRRFKV